MSSTVYNTPADLYAAQQEAITSGGSGNFGPTVTVGGATWSWDGSIYRVPAPGSPSNPFTSLTDPDPSKGLYAYATANLATLRSGVTTAWAGTPAAEYVWVGPGAGNWRVVADDLQRYVVTEASESAIRAQVASAQAAGSGVVVIPPGRIPLTAPLPMGGGIGYDGAPWGGVDSAAEGYALTGTVLVCDGSFNCFEYAASDAASPNPIGSQAGMDWDGGILRNIGIEGADYGIKIGAKWRLGISGLTIGNIYTLNCNYGVWLENCPNINIGFISPNRNKKSGFVLASSSNGWNYGNCEILQVSGNGHRTEQIPGYPGVMLLSRGGNSHINDVRIGHVNYAFNRGANQETGTATHALGSSSFDIGDLADKVDINHPVFFGANSAGLHEGRAYFVTSKTGTSVTVSLLWGGADVIATAAGSCAVKTLGHIGLAFVGIEGCAYTYCKAEIIDVEQCAIGVFSQNGKGGTFNYGCWDANDESGIISFVGRDVNTISGAVTVSFPQKFQLSDIGDHGLYFATGYLPKTQLNPNKDFIGAGVDFYTNTVVNKERWNSPLASFPSANKDRQIIEYAASLSPSGFVRMQRVSGVWRPLPDEVIAYQKGSPLAQLDSGALTSTPVFESEIIPLALIPDGTEIYIEAFVDVASASGQSNCLIGAAITGTPQPLAMNSGVFALYTSMTPSAGGNLPWPPSVRAKVRRVANKIVGINGASAATSTLNSKYGVEISTIGEGVTRFVLQATRSNAADVIRLLSYRITVAG